VNCSQDPVGPFYHTRSSATIAQVSFHPWGVDDTTLLVLTSDGLIREYNILEDPEEPTQILDFSQPDGERSVPPVEPLPHRGVRYGLNSTPSRRRETSASATPSRRRSRSRPRSRSRSRATPSHSLNHAKTGQNGMFGLMEDTASKAVSFCLGKGDSDWTPFTLYCLMQNGDLFCVCPYLPKTA
jgi:nucleoporin NUP82